MRDFLTVRDAAAALGMKRETLLRRIQRGSIRGTKLGWIWLVPSKEVERVKNTKTVKNTGRTSQ